MADSRATWKAGVFRRFEDRLQKGLLLGPKAEPSLFLATISGIRRSKKELSELAGAAMTAMDPLHPELQDLWVAFEMFVPRFGSGDVRLRGRSLEPGTTGGRWRVAEEAIEHG
jgi:hypothetical protein